MRFAALKRARITLSKSGMEKFACASAMRRGIAVPRVTLVYVPLGKLPVVQPVKFAAVQVGPVKPFVQMQAHEPLSKIEVPPFWHAVAVPLEQVARAEVVGDEVLGLWKTRSSKGTTTAAAIITSRIRRTRRNPHTGRPQQRRRLGGRR